MEIDRSKDPVYGPADVFAFFNETCHTTQLSEALVDRCLPGELHRSHFYILNFLARGGDGAKPLQITAAMQVTKTTISHSLAVLEKKGFIETRQSTIDARSKQVFITQAGRELQTNAVTELTSLFGTILGKEDYRMMGEALPSLVAIRKRLQESSDVAPD